MLGHKADNETRHLRKARELDDALKLQAKNHPPPARPFKLWPASGVQSKDEQRSASRRIRAHSLVLAGIRNRGYSVKFTGENRV